MQLTVITGAAVKAKEAGFSATSFEDTEAIEGNTTAYIKRR